MGAARQAVAQARANRAAQVRPVTLAPVTPTPNGEWRSPIQVDPFTVPVADKVALLLAANAAALKVAGAVTAVSKDFSDFQTRDSTDVPSMGLGYEHVTRADFVTNAARWASGPTTRARVS